MRPHAPSRFPFSVWAVSSQQRMLLNSCWPEPPQSKWAQPAMPILAPSSALPVDWNPGAAAIMSKRSPASPERWSFRDRQPRLYRHILTRSVASEKPLRRGGVRRVWLFQAQGRQRSMSDFSPQPEGTGPIFPISSLLVAPVTGYSSLLAPRTEKNWLPSLSCQYMSIQPRAYSNSGRRETGKRAWRSLRLCAGRLQSCRPTRSNARTIRGERLPRRAYQWHRWARLRSESCVRAPNREHRLCATRAGNAGNAVAGKPGKERLWSVVMAGNGKSLAADRSFEQRCGFGGSLLPATAVKTYPWLRRPCRLQEAASFAPDESRLSERLKASATSRRGVHLPSARGAEAIWYSRSAD